MYLQTPQLLNVGLLYICCINMTHFCPQDIKLSPPLGFLKRSPWVSIQWDTHFINSDTLEYTVRTDILTSQVQLTDTLGLSVGHWLASCVTRGLSRWLAEGFEWGRSHNDGRKKWDLVRVRKRQERFSKHTWEPQSPKWHNLLASARQRDEECQPTALYLGRYNISYHTIFKIAQFFSYWRLQSIQSERSSVLFRVLVQLKCCTLYVSFKSFCHRKHEFD